MKYPKIGHRYTVRSVPSFRILQPKGDSEFTGDLTSIIPYCQQFIPSFAEKVDSTWLPSKSTRPEIIFFTTKKSIPPFFKILSSSFNKTARIGVFK